jgi:hypothetical protein
VRRGLHKQDRRRKAGKGWRGLQAVKGQKAGRNAADKTLSIWLKIEDDRSERRA